MSSNMRVISRARIEDFCKKSPKAAREMHAWLCVTSTSAWRHPADVKRSFGGRVDFVAVDSGATVFVFDIANTHWRMIVAIHFVAKRPESGRVYILRILTHNEYDTNRWKKEL